MKINLSTLGNAWNTVQDFARQVFAFGGKSVKTIATKDNAAIAGSVLASVTVFKLVYNKASSLLASRNYLQDSKGLKFYARHIVLTASASGASFAVAKAAERLVPGLAVKTTIVAGSILGAAIHQYGLFSKLTSYLPTWPKAPAEQKEEKVEETKTN